MRIMQGWTRALVAALFLVVSSLMASAQTPGSGWPTYGGDPGGDRYSGAGQITRENVGRLQPVWVYHTGALLSTNHFVKRFDFEATPILFHETLYLTTPVDKIIALDPATGVERWTFDPHLADDVLATNYTSRGVAAWQGLPTEKVCRSRIFVATLDARLIAVDATTGAPCPDFGRGGEVDLKAGVPTRKDHPYQFFGNSSPPTVVGDVVVVGSAVPDNQAIDVEPGYVRGFDVRTGALKWTWDPMPWAKSQRVRTGGGNAWGVIAADTERGILYVPTGSPAPDFFGGTRPGNDADANSLVALDAATGRKIWAFQLVHHDMWDYDTAAEPLLFTYQDKTPAVAVVSKVGMVFVLNRLTGEPLFPIEERPVPRSDVKGEDASPTQPFSSLPALNPQTYDPKSLEGHTLANVSDCDTKLAHLRYEGVYTPPSLRGSLQFPGSLGGVNWSGMAFDPTTGVLYANTNRSAYEMRLLPQPDSTPPLLRSRRLWFGLAAVVLVLGGVVRRSWRVGYWAVGCAVALIVAGFWMKMKPRGDGLPTQQYKVNSPDSIGEVSPQNGTPYRIYRRVLQDFDGRPCTPTPWGAMTALDLVHGVKRWERPLGTMIEGKETGTVNFGAPMVTGGGLVFTAASQQPLLRAFDKGTGEEVWAGKLPVPAQSTPMSYEVKGRQFIVISSGGHGAIGTALGDSVVAFSLRD